MRSVITGTGIGLPPHVVTNDALAKIMDTSDDWIRARSGVETRRYAEPGQGSAELGAIAAENALGAAGCAKESVDAAIFATMTPNYFFPGNGPVLQRLVGLPHIPTFDIRQQCCGFLYALDLADSLIQSRRYRKVLVVGGEVHSPFLPWLNGWDTLIGLEEREITDEERAANTWVRDRGVLFGDGAGAAVIEAREDGDAGFLGSKLYTDGGTLECLHVKGVGFRRRPYVTVEQIEAREMIPSMEGREVFRQAVIRMPESVRAATAAFGVRVEDIDLLLVHQANLRIVEAVAKALALPPERVPHNIEKYGNTTAGTLPILYHECLEQGLVKPGMLVAFTALGSGLHWGTALYRA